MGIERVDVHRLAIPLERPYRLAFGPVHRYDTVLVTLEVSDGRNGFGEATLLTGYTDETIDEASTLARDLAQTLPGTAFADARARLVALGAKAPFVATAFHTALDMAEGHPLLAPAAQTRVPILGLLQGDDVAELRERFEALLAQGYRTVKVKVGFDVARDLAFVARVQAVVAGRAPIRVDANQGYSASAAAQFVAAVDPAGIELFEQPCAAGDWAAHRRAAAAAQRTGLPLMLDESIYGLSDIERAATEGACAYVKVKLMKFVGIDALVAAISRIRSLGMRPVLGNGVACDVSCWMEACVAARHIDNAGEMNGFQKAPRTLFRTPLAFDRGDIVLDDARPELDADALAAHRIDHASFALPRIACPTPSSPA
ncbi:MAG: mandelate racemase/muconate lactonizing enzyme family protein [Rudaea sp.]